MKIERKILMIMFLIGFMNVSAQKYLFDTQHISTEDGLSNLMTNTIFKDHRGFLWISNKYGLDKYDGHRFIQYNVENQGFYEGGYICKIDEDDDGNLWLFRAINKQGAVLEIDIFNPITTQTVSFGEHFKNKAPFKASEAILMKVNDFKKRLWLSNNKGQIFFYKQGQFQKVFEQKGFICYSLLVAKDNTIWLGGKEKLIHINLSGQVLESFNVLNKVGGIWDDKEGNIWMTNLEFKSNTKKTSIWVKGKDSITFQSLSLTKNENVLTWGERATRDRNGFWYITIDHNIQLFNSKGEWLFDFNSLLGKEKQTDFTDYLVTKENIWFSSPIGITRINVKENPFSTLYKREALSDCRQITEDENGNIYFLNGFAYQWNKKTKQVKKLVDKPVNIGLIYEDSTVFAGFYHSENLGFQIDLRTNKITDFGKASHSILQTLFKTSREGLYLMGQTKGLGYLNLDLKNYLPFDQYNSFDKLKDAAVYFFHRNTAGIWIATEIGLFLMDEKKGILQHFDKESGALPFANIRHIYEDKEGVFWLATRGGGIIRWEPPTDQNKKGTSRQFTISNGLSNNYTYAIYEDDFNNLWISSDKGLMCMDKENYHVKTYLTKEGLPHNEFNQGAHYQGKDGTLYFGGLGGLIAFHPKDLVKDFDEQIPFEFTKFYILENDRENITDKTKLVHESGKVTIEPEDKFFEVHFTLLDFKPSEDHSYAYQIEGYSDHWNYINENYIRITNLPYGSYQIKIKGKNRKNDWLKEELIVKVLVLRPFYLQWWFLMTCILLGMGLIIIVLKWRERKIRKNQEILEWQVKERTQTIQQQAEKLEALDKVKTRFFSNITHELRTPLTLIIGPIEQVIAQSTANTQKKLNVVLKNARHLLTLINQMLDVSKIESGQMNVAISRGDIIMYTKELTKRFQSLAEANQQQLNFISQETYWETFFDKNKWDKIVYNLLSNAFKFTPSGKAIQLSLVKVKKQEKDFIRLDVKDTGIGIDKKNLKQIFNRFYQIDYSSTREQEGTGIGLALVKELVELQGGEITVSSQLHKGTSFEVYIPVLNLEEEHVFVGELTMDTALLPKPNEPVIAPENEKVESRNEEKLDILIIEDNEDMRAYIKSCIDGSLYNLIDAENGEEGINKALDQIPDLIISDVMMPKKDGFEVLQVVKNHINTSHIPVVLLTAKAALKSRLQGLEYGADAYLTKPFSPQELMIRIHKLIELRRLLQQHYQNNEVLPSRVEDLKKEDPFIAELRAYILENIDEANLSGDFIGKHFAISRVHLHRKLKALTNQPISEFVRSIRLKRSLELLKEGRLNVSEIAHQTGFSSISHFSRSFKKAYGKAPSKM